ncbi:chitinase-3-like protein 1 [Harmonia axyridis]|uniref:chitinase-3-like protein 1 n=1 Tax=Harmonia axyridis TaxID=115357 RepID=UPI001E276056|nr:chitinase-3-like protein 1 [Harmonia axyridis]
MSKWLFIFSSLFCVFFSFVEPKTDRVICYYGSWANYRNGNGKYTAENIDSHLCTHIIYTFLGIENDGNLKILDTWLELDLRNLERFNALKRQNSNLKTLIAVGGWNEGSIKYSRVASDPLKRANLINSAIKIMETYGFNGFDIDWEYPAQRGGASVDKGNFAILLKEFREAFDKKGFILTAAVAAAPFSVDISYDVPALSKYLDSINVMAYDLHGAYDGVTGANAPLYPSSIDSSPSAKALTVDASIRNWIARGADPQKISMGLPLYGRTFTLSNPTLNGIGAPVVIGGRPGPYTQETGMLGYLEICELQQQGGWTVNWDDNTKTPYAYKGDQWIGYDNSESIRFKVQYAKDLNLGGIMIWSLETADFNGICGESYPILTSIKKTINENDTTTTALPEPTPCRTENCDEPKPNNKDDSKESKDSESSPEKSATTTTTAKPENDNNPKNSDDTKSSSASDESKSSESSNESKQNDDSSKDSSGSKEHNEDSKDSNKSSESDSQDDSEARGNGNEESVCKELGLFRNNKDCSAFFYCIPDLNGIRKVDFKCSDGLVFDSEFETCNFKSLVDCNA